MSERFEKFSYSISVISRSWRRFAAKELRKYGLKSSHAIYLTTIYKHPSGITIPELCDICGKDKSDASRMITILEKKGLVKKHEVKGSLYRGVLMLTHEGKTAAEEISRRASRLIELAGKDLTGETREAFYQALETVAKNLNKLSKKGLPE